MEQSNDPNGDPNDPNNRKRKHQKKYKQKPGGMGSSSGNGGSGNGGPRGGHNSRGGGEGYGYKDYKYENQQSGISSSKLDESKVNSYKQKPPRKDKYQSNSNVDYDGEKYDNYNEDRGQDNGMKYYDDNYHESQKGINHDERLDHNEKNKDYDRQYKSNNQQDNHFKNKHRQKRGGYHDQNYHKDTTYKDNRDKRNMGDRFDKREHYNPGNASKKDIRPFQKQRPYKNDQSSKVSGEQTPIIFNNHDNYQQYENYEGQQQYGENKYHKDRNSRHTERSGNHTQYSSYIQSPTTDRIKLHVGSNEQSIMSNSYKQSRGGVSMSTKESEQHFGITTEEMMQQQQINTPAFTSNGELSGKMQNKDVGSPYNQKKIMEINMISNLGRASPLINMNEMIPSLDKMIKSDMIAMEHHQGKHMTNKPINLNSERKYREYDQDFTDREARKKKKKTIKQKTKRVQQGPSMEQLSDRNSNDNRRQNDAYEYKQKPVELNVYGGYQTLARDEDLPIKEHNNDYNYHQVPKTTIQAPNLKEHPNISSPKYFEYPRAIENPYSAYRGGKNIQHQCPIEYHETSKNLWQINSNYFKTVESSDYESYYSQEEAKDLVANGKAFKGTISFRDGWYSIGLIQSEDFVKRVYAKGFDLNRAIHGSEIIFCPRGDNWKQYLVINQTQTLKDFSKIQHAELMAEEQNYYNDMKRKYNKYSQQPYEDMLDNQTDKILVQVIYIEKNPLLEKPFVVKLKEDPSIGYIGQYLFNNKYPLFKVIHTDIYPKLEVNTKSYYLARFEKWPNNDKLPTLSLISNLGEIGTIDSEVRAILKLNEIQAKSHSNKELIEFNKKHNIARDQVYTIPEEVLQGRTDLRTAAVFSIDSQKSKKIQNCISIEKIQEDLYQIGVHVSDVSFFIEKDSHIDVEASKNSNSFNLPNKTYSMLPDVLEANVCCLKSGKDSLTFSSFFKVNGLGQIVANSGVIEKTVINPKCNLTYDIVEAILAGQITSAENFPI